LLIWPGQSRKAGKQPLFHAKMLLLFLLLLFSYCCFLILLLFFDKIIFHLTPKIRFYFSMTADVATLLPECRLLYELLFYMRFIAPSCFSGSRRQEAQQSSDKTPVES